jgi:hypothetical protein
MTDLDTCRKMNAQLRDERDRAHRRERKLLQDQQRTRDMLSNAGFVDVEGLMAEWHQRGLRLIKAQALLDARYKACQEVLAQVRVLVDAKKAT